MTRISYLPLVAMLSGGCIIYEQGLDGTSGGRPGGRPDGTDTATDTAPPAPQINLFLDPPGAVIGTNSIVSLYGDGTVDLSTIANVQFYGESGIDVLATDTRGTNEFLLTLSVPADAPAGANDMLVTFQDGTAVYVETAFQVVTSVDQIPAPQGTPPTSCN